MKSSFHLIALSLGAISTLAQSGDPAAYAVAVAQKQSPPLAALIKKNKLQPFCQKLLACNCAPLPTAVKTVTSTVATNVQTVSTGPNAFVFQQVAGSTFQGVVTYPTRRTVATVTSTSTTTITVGTFTQTDTVTRGRKKREYYKEDKEILDENAVTFDAFEFEDDAVYADEEHFLAARAAATCPTFPKELQRTDAKYSIPTWTYVIVNACSLAIGAPAPVLKTQNVVIPATRTRTTYLPTATVNVPAAVKFLATSYSIQPITVTKVIPTYNAVFSYVTTTKTVDK